MMRQETQPTQPLLPLPLVLLDTTLEYFTLEELYIYNRHSLNPMYDKHLRGSGLGVLEERALCYAATTGWLAGLEVFACDMTSVEAGQVMEWAAQGGQVRAIEWGRAKLRENAPIWEICNRCLSKAAAGGHVPIMEWLAQISSSHDWGSVVRLAAQGGHVEAMKWLATRDPHRECGWTTILHVAAEAGQLAAMEYAALNGAYVANGTLCSAAEGGHVQAMEWAVTHSALSVENLGWNIALACAAKGGHLGAMEWLATKGASNWNSALVSAAQHNQVAATTFALKKGATLR